jgi:anti-sigma factor RsiW
MSARLDGELDATELSLLEEHLALCPVCRAEWTHMQALDRLLASAPLIEAPVRVRVHVMTQLERRDQARRAIIGGTTLTLGTVALALLVLAPALLGLLRAMDVAPVLLRGGPATVTQAVNAWTIMGRAFVGVLERFALPLAAVGLCGLTTALLLNGLWIGAVRRLRASQR